MRATNLHESPPVSPAVKATRLRRKNTNLESDIVELRNTRDNMLEALKSVFKLIEDGDLVRSIKNDDKPDWIIDQFAFVGVLQKGQQAIDKAEKSNV